MSPPTSSARTYCCVQPQNAVIGKFSCLLFISDGSDVSAISTAPRTIPAISDVYPLNVFCFRETHGDVVDRAGGRRMSDDRLARQGVLSAFSIAIAAAETSGESDRTADEGTSRCL